MKNLTKSDFDNSTLRYRTEQQSQNQETKDSDWRFNKVNSMTI